VVRREDPLSTDKADHARELQRRAGAELEVEAPDHGMHLVAYLRGGRSDVAAERAAGARGVVVRAISALYTAAPPRSGLLLGFTGFAPGTIAPAVARLAASVGDVARPGEARAPRPSRRD
jgi:GntR family transcriptional regulator / MocR family aminotransferase